MKKLLMLASMLCLTLCLSTSANALECTVQAPNGPEYADATSVEPVVTADRGEQANRDLSKNTALIPPAFGSPTSNLLGSGEPLTPNLGGAILSPVGGIISGPSTTITPPGATVIPSVPSTSITPVEPVQVTSYTDVTSDLYYKNGHLGTLKIPSLDVNVKVYQGTGASVLAKGAGHFEGTSIWDGNCCIAGHNRGANCYFGEIHTLGLGDKITLTTKLGTRTYAVTSVSKISEMDRSMLAPTVENCITLYTCVKNQSNYRWCVRAVEVN
ncbi:MAG: class D sortase [Oscillospiraceae bacterium]|jgi:LPXTG-site transpeptidase (sortase) family protein|nr:class D sortase [Oscillospiraceae bacterium]